MTKKELMKKTPHFLTSHHYTTKRTPVIESSQQLEHARDWVKIFKDLSIADHLHTTIAQLEEIPDFLEHDPDGDISLYETSFFWLILCLNKDAVASHGDIPDLVACTFYDHDKAHIDPINECPYSAKYPKLLNIGFFGFHGSWRDVYNKLVTAEKILAKQELTAYAD